MLLTGTFSSRARRTRSVCVVALVRVRRPRNRVRELSSNEPFVPKRIPYNEKDDVRLIRPCEDVITGRFHQLSVCHKNGTTIVCFLLPSTGSAMHTEQYNRFFFTYQLFLVHQQNARVCLQVDPRRGLYSLESLDRYICFVGKPQAYEDQHLSYNDVKAISHRDISNRIEKFPFKEIRFRDRESRCRRQTCRSDQKVNLGRRQTLFEKKKQPPQPSPHARSDGKLHTCPLTDSSILTSLEANSLPRPCFVCACLGTRFLTSALLDRAMAEKMAKYRQEIQQVGKTSFTHTSLSLFNIWVQSSFHWLNLSNHSCR